MTSSNWKVRRATVEDVRKLGPLWDQAQLPRQTLEPRFKEFQVVEEENGDLTGAIGFLIAGTEGWLHSETFAHPDQAEELRALLWERAQIQAKNHGLVRIWTQLTSPFWPSSGLQFAGEDILAKLPESWAPDGRPWLCLQLRNDLPPELSIDKEFAMFREQGREQTQKMLQQARIMKMAAGVISVVVFLMALVWLVFFLKMKYGSGGP